MTKMNIAGFVDYQNKFDKFVYYTLRCTIKWYDG